MPFWLQPTGAIELIHTDTGSFPHPVDNFFFRRASADNLRHFAASIDLRITKHTGARVFAHYSLLMTNTPHANQPTARDLLISGVRRLRWAPAEMAVYLGLPPDDIAKMLAGEKATPEATSSKLLFAISIAPDGDGYVSPAQARQRLEELAQSVIVTASSPLTRIQTVALYGLMTSLAIGAIGGLFVSLKWIVDGMVWLIEQLWNTSLEIVGPVALVVLASLIFTVRCKCRATYGVTEILLALVVGFNQLPKYALAAVPSDFDKRSLLVGLTAGSVYFMVRGMDNVKEGRKNDLVFNFCMRLFRRLWSRARDR